MKYVLLILWVAKRPVAPHWGAWIEMRLRTAGAPPVTVAPHWGAWIEIITGTRIRCI